MSLAGLFAPFSVARYLFVGRALVPLRLLTHIKRTYLCFLVTVSLTYLLLIGVKLVLRTLQRALGAVAVVGVLMAGVYLLFAVAGYGLFANSFNSCNDVGTNLSLNPFLPFL